MTSNAQSCTCFPYLLQSQGAHTESATHLPHCWIIGLVSVQLVLDKLGQHSVIFVIPAKAETKTGTCVSPREGKASSDHKRITVHRCNKPHKADSFMRKPKGVIGVGWPDASCPSSRAMLSVQDRLAQDTIKDDGIKTAPFLKQHQKFHWTMVKTQFPIPQGLHASLNLVPNLVPVTSSSIHMHKSK